MNRTRTKIVCTIGPASQSPEVIRGMLQAGMSVARINFSHGDHMTHRAAIATLRQVAKEEGQRLAIMADLQGPKLRVGKLPDEGLRLEEGDHVVLALPESEVAEGIFIPVPHPQLLADLHPGEPILLDDGRLILRVEQTAPHAVYCSVLVGGHLTSHKGISAPQTQLRMSALTTKDQQDVRFAIKQAVDYIALSFVRGPSDVQALRQLLAAYQADIPIVAKIERRDALEHFEAILAEADAIMVARGDLGVETPAEEVPFHQKRIIRLCNQAGKPVITATEMLQTMIENPRPTRAEASDVANAILDGTDAVMLSGETAVGQYPVEAVETMARICRNAEAHLQGSAVTSDEVHGASEITEAMSDAAVSIAREVEARAIVTATMSGLTARMVARHRPPMPIIAVTPSEATLYRLALVWGVEGVRVPHFQSTDEMVRLMVEAARQHGLAAPGDRLVLTAGVPFGKRPATNLVYVHVVVRSELAEAASGD